MDNFEKELYNLIDIEIAKNVKNWREEEDLTWRAIAYDFIQKYPKISEKLNILNTQPFGLSICKVSKKILENTIYQWNNYE